MFATVSGALPRPPTDGGGEAGEDELVRAILAAQESAGIEALTDGRVRSGDLFHDVTAWSQPGRWVAGRSVAAWRFAAATTELPVKQALPGPYGIGLQLAGSRTARRRRTLDLARAVNVEARALAAAGCPLVEVEEAVAGLVGDDERERSLFRETHRIVTEGVEGTHLSLALVGPSADAAGAVTVFDAPYASYLFDLIGGPDNWRLVVQAPRDRGIVCGALRATADGDEGSDLLVWAAHYAASTGGRGLGRVGLANAAGLDALSWDVAVRKLSRLGDASRIAGLPATGQLAAALDPRSVSSRSAAAGRRVRRPPKG